MALDLRDSFQKVNYDIYTGEVYSDFWGKQGDTGRGFDVTIWDEGQLIVPSTEILRLNLRKPDGKIVWVESYIVGNAFRIELTNQVFAEVGEVKSEFEIVSHGKVRKSETFIIESRESMINGIQSENQFGRLEFIITKIESFEVDMNDFYASETQRALNEGVRISSENTRITNETNRQTKESERLSNESTRISQESSRVSSENIRVSDENIRKSNETSRISAEGTRVTQENTRKSQETSRVNAEDSRITAETGRVNAENTRVTAESSRATAESTRVSNENSRISAESGRVTAESTRVNQESSRVNAEGDSTKGRVKAENLRVTAETGRVNAESTRVTNESTRQNNESTRISNENNRISQESTRQANTSSALQQMGEAVQSTMMVYKQSVSTYSNIATTYPNPETGWRVEVNDTKNIYRYDGVSWINISDAALGFVPENVANKGKASGYAPLDASSKVPLSNLPPLNYIPTSEKASVNGVASLGSDGKVPSSQLPPLDYALSSHTHSRSQITDLGTVASINTDTSTSNYLRGDGTWATPPNTTYSEITEAEVLAGTASTSRTITARRLKYLMDNVKAANSGNADTVNGLTVLTAVPSGAVFTDTIYTHPASHPATMITEDATHRFVTDTEKTTWSNKASKATTIAGYGITDGVTYSEHLALYNMVQNDYLPLSGSIMNGKITGHIPSTYASTTIQGVTSAPFGLNNIAVSANTFVPFSHMSATHSGGYVTHLTTGLYKTTTSWSGSGYFVGLGGSDASPTEYFLLEYGGKIKHSSGNISFDSITSNGTLTTSNNQHTLTTPHGNIQIGPMNDGHAHIYTDRPNFYFNKEILINGIAVSKDGHTHAYIPTSASCNKNWNWSGQGGQPTWLWGGNDGTNMYVYNPSNFSVAYATSASLLGGYGFSTSASANSIVQRTPDGYIFATYFNSSRGYENSSAGGYIYDTGDGYMRRKALSNVQGEIVTNGAVKNAIADGVYVNQGFYLYTSPASGKYMVFGNYITGSQGTEQVLMPATAGGWTALGTSANGFWKGYSYGWTTLSDKNIKDEILPFSHEESYDMLKTLKFYSYKYQKLDDDGVNTNWKHTLGVVAQDAPYEITSYGYDGSPDNAIDLYSYSTLLGSALQAVQVKLEEQIEKNQTLEQRLNELEALVFTLV